MNNNTTHWDRIEIVQRTALGVGADQAERIAAREAESRRPGFRAVAVRWLGADAFDRHLGGRWVELEVELAAA